MKEVERKEGKKREKELSNRYFHNNIVTLFNSLLTLVVNVSKVTKRAQAGGAGTIEAGLTRGTVAADIEATATATATATAG